MFWENEFEKQISRLVATLIVCLQILILSDKILQTSPAKRVLLCLVSDKRTKKSLSVFKTGRLDTCFFLKWENLFGEAILQSHGLRLCGRSN